MFSDQFSHPFPRFVLVGAFVGNCDFFVCVCYFSFREVNKTNSWKLIRKWTRSVSKVLYGSCSPATYMRRSNEFDLEKCVSVSRYSNLFLLCDSYKHNNLCMFSWAGYKDPRKRVTPVLPIFVPTHLALIDREYGKQTNFRWRISKFAGLPCLNWQLWGLHYGNQWSSERSKLSKVLGHA